MQAGGLVASFLGVLISFFLVLRVPAGPRGAQSPVRSSAGHQTDASRETL